MENVIVSERNCANQVNKENIQPAYRKKSSNARAKTAVAPFHLKSNDKETGAKSGPLKAKAKEMDKQSTSSVAPKKMVAEAPKPPAVEQSSTVPGMYKGKVVQSKIRSLWKPSTSLDGEDSKTENQRDSNVSQKRSTSALPQCGVRRPAPSTLKSASHRPAQAAKPAVASHPPARTVPATLTSTGSRNRSVATTKGSGTLTAKPKVPVTDRRVNKPPVTSSLSRHRLSMETTEERRAKLADWLAAKGKTSKRPAMVAAAPSNTRFSKSGVHLKSQSGADTLPALQSEPVQEPRLEACKADSPAAETKVITGIQTPVFINTGANLLEDSGDVAEEVGMDDIVVNLCEALEAVAVTMESRDVSEKPGESEVEDSKPKEVASDTNESENLVLLDDEVEKDRDEMETPEMGDVSVIKYSVKTTPYLQSVKKTIEGAVNTSVRKGNIKDLKFLTPVRRSTRIHRKSSRMPAMLVDHDPCVSSLAELVKLDDDSNAYIYRRNTALLDDLPDEPRL